MGSGNNNRKKSDQPLIRRPQNLVSSISSNNEHVSAADICPISFDVKINKTNLTIVDVAVMLHKEDDKYIMKVLGNNIGALSQRNSDTVTKCSAIGISYTGRIVEIKGNVYARFVRAA